MARPQIRPTIFIALQNGLAALLFASLLAAEIVRRLLHAYPQVDILWQLSTLANRTVMPVLLYAEQFHPTPGWLTAGLLAGIIVPLLAWWTRYWFATALAGHVTLAALIVMTHATIRRGTLSLPSLDLDGLLGAARPGAAVVILAALTLFVLVMCLADHLAFLRFLVSLFRRSKRTA
jgi:hypothetical protein